MTVERPSPFPLRLARSTSADAHMLAQKCGMSLNQFIIHAVNEKIVRLSPQPAPVSRAIT
jgi:predicted HicB family RNase H-like nuclease